MHSIIEGDQKAYNAQNPLYLPPFTRNRGAYFNDLANVSHEENPYLHEEPYGYLFSDDVKIFKIIN